MCLPTVLSRSINDVPLNLLDHLSSQLSNTAPFLLLHYSPLLFWECLFTIFAHPATVPFPSTPYSSWRTKGGYYKVPVPYLQPLGI